MKKEMFILKKLIKFALDKNAYKKYDRIFLLSHMRANTSLLGHILGSQEEINGYYEKHLTYKTRYFSLINQKMEHTKHHRFKKNSRYIFDKLLHNDYELNHDLLADPSIQFIISLRSPQGTIPSIITQVKKRNPKNTRATFSGASDYYKQRLNKLHNYAEQLSGRFIYLDAESLKLETVSSLKFLTKELDLNYDLKPHFKKQNLTGIGSSGDHSGDLNKGVIIKKETDYSDVAIPEEGMSEIEAFYQKKRQEIIKLSKVSLTTK